ncbi:MAG: hypothetical protein ISS16_12065 [Ignavibacteria bacterium]|nr:hypothetical protein [Ignavibacteria bacterium]
MKKKTNLLSSLLIALIAGFIYFQFGGVEDIKSIASLGFRMVSEPIEDITTTQLASNGIRINITNKKMDGSSKQNVNENYVYIKNGSKNLAVIDHNSNTISFTNNHEGTEVPFFENSPMTIEGEITFSPEYFVPFSKDNDIYLETIRIPNYQEYITEADPLVDYYKATIPIEICNVTPMSIKLTDSNTIELNIKGLEWKGMNHKLNVAMKKLNTALRKLSENLKDMDFRFHIEGNQEEFELSMKEFEAGMKEFEQEMREFGYDFEQDMKEFEQDMKEYEEDMKEYEEDMKEYEKDMKEYEQDMREYEQDMKEYEEDVKEYEQDMREYEKNMREYEQDIKEYEQDYEEYIEEESI